MGLGKHECSMPTSLQAVLLEYNVHIFHMYSACFVIFFPTENDRQLLNFSLRVPCLVNVLVPQGIW